MNIFSQLTGIKQTDPILFSTIEHAVVKVEPRIKQIRGYPNAFRKSVMSALEYAHELALNVPGPVAVSPESYADDSYVHAIFPSLDFITEAFRASRALQDYLREHPTANETYALMGMRRLEKSIIGLELSGDIIQRDVPQRVVYFTSHTIADPAHDEKQARELVALSFFNNLVDKVAKRVELRKQEMQAQLQEIDLLKARLHASNAQTRPALQTAFSQMLTSAQMSTRSLDLQHYLDDFETVLLNPQQHLRLDQSPMILDSMGVKRNNDESTQGETIMFNDLIGYDRRNWTVTLVHCRDIQRETFASRLETAYRSLSNPP